MPSFKSPKYTPEKSAEIAVCAFTVLDEAKTALTLDEIKARDLTLVSVSPQKLSRELTKYTDIGLLHKTKKGTRIAYECVG